MKSGEPTTRQLVEHIHALLHHEQHGLEHQHRLLHRILERMDQIMTTQAELQQIINDNSVKVQANTDELASIKLVIDGLKASNAKIQADLDAAIAAGDPAAIQAAADLLRAQGAMLDSQKIAEDALANTDAAPAP